MRYRMNQEEIESITLSNVLRIHRSTLQQEEVKLTFETQRHKLKGNTF